MVRWDIEVQRWSNEQVSGSREREQASGSANGRAIWGSPYRGFLGSFSACFGNSSLLRETFLL